jgi:glycosyltransferase involved in cell wall biosynthesis
MNVLFFTSQPPDGTAGGVERVVARISTGLRERGMTVYTASFYMEQSDPVENHFWVTSTLRKRMTAEIIAIVQENNIQTIVLHETGYSILRIFKDIKCQLPDLYLIIECHHIIADNEYIVSWCLYSLKHSGPAGKILKGIFILPFIILAVLRSYLAFYMFVTISDRFVLLSRKFFTDLQKRLFFIRIDKKRPAVIPNPLSFPLEETDVSQKENIVLFVGRLKDGDKNIFEIVRIWKKIETMKTTGNWKLLIIGDGPDKQKMIQRAQKYRLKNIEWLGRQNPVEWYKKAKILMLASREGWGLTLTEAMQFKIIPIAYQSYSSVTDIIHDGYNGYLIKNRNTRLYAEKLSWIMENYGHLQDVRRNGGEHIQQFAIEKIIDKWIGLLSEEKLNYFSP